MSGPSAATRLTGPLPSELRYVTFAAPAQTTVTPTVHAETWIELQQRLTRHQKRANKNGAGWSPAVYRHDTRGRLLTRKLGNVESVTAAVADVDHVGLDDVQALTEHVKSLGLAGVLASTYSHSVTAPRVRVVVPFAEPVPAELWPRLWPALNAHIFLGLADRAASDASRMYFLPSTPGDETTIGESWDGAALDWRALPLADAESIHAAVPVVTESSGSAESVAADDMPILEKLFSGRLGDKRMRAWTGDYSDFNDDESAADMSIANGLVVYCAGDVVRAERIMRGGCWRPRWDERRGSTTWLGYTLGKALAAYRRWAGEPDEPEQEQNNSGYSAPDETLEQRVTRVERELADERRSHAQTRAVNAVQMTTIRALRADVERLNRTAYADYRLTKSKLKPDSARLREHSCG